MQHASHFYQTPSIRIRLSIVVIAFACIGVGMLCRSTWIQIIGDPKLENLAKRQFHTKFSEKPRRGLITDRAGEPLAINLESSSLAGNPSKILKSRSTLHLLSRALGVSVPALKKNLNAKKSFAWIERHVTDERLKKFKKSGILFGDGEMPEGLWIVKEMKRIYPHAEMAAPLLGTVNVDAQGLEGVELWKEATLRGKSATVDAIKDALGRPALMNSSSSAKTEDGKNIELSLDTSLQFGVEEALKESMLKTKSQSGLAIVMDSATGEILALAQNPSFNPNLKSSGGPHRKMKALTDGYEPGSTLKPLLLAAALGSGMKSTDQLHGHFGKFKVQNRSINEAEAHEKFGYISLKKMIEVSSNIVAAELGLKLGAEKYLSFLRELGFGQKTGTQFPGEVSGWIPSNPKQVKPLSLANIAFGQGIVVTPMQMLRAYAALSNGGYLVEPTLLKQEDQDRVRKVPVMRSQVIKEVTQALLGVTEGTNGTGKSARVEGFKIAGKTGTAQTVDPRTKQYSSTRYISSFVGYPVGIKQSITILTLLDHPKGIFFASQTAAPLFSAVLKKVISRYSIPATEPIAQPLAQSSNTPAQEPLATREISSESENEKVNESSVSSLIVRELMPSLVGLTPQEAMSTLKSFAPKIQIHGFGVIKRQIPESGSPLHAGARVTLFLGE